MKKLLLFVLFPLLPFSLHSTEEPLILSTQDIDGVINITSFFSNGEGEIFLFSYTEGKIFKFKPNGNFDKSFCRLGQGPGEIMRVIYMFLNPANDFLYLPECFSSQKRVTIFDSDGNYQKTLKVDLPIPLMDKIWKLSFLKDGSFYLMTMERVGWKPIGKIFTTQNKIEVRYFNKKGDFVSDIFTVIMDEELSNGPRWGGPQILFKPSVLMELTSEENIAIGKTDENFLTVFDRKGNKLKIIKLEIPREKLNENEFQREKASLVALISDSRMKSLARKMIKLDYKPIYSKIFLEEGCIILSKILERNESFYVKKSELVLFHWKGNKLGRNTIQGEVMNIQRGKVFIKSVDMEGYEHFRIKSIESDNSLN